MSRPNREAREPNRRPVSRARLPIFRPVLERASVAAAAITPAAAADANATLAPRLSLWPLERPCPPARIDLMSWRASLPEIERIEPDRPLLADRPRDRDDDLDPSLWVVVGMALPSFDECAIAVSGAM